MQNWSGAERIVAVKAYKYADSVTAAQRVFRLHYQLGHHGRVPSAHAINTWVRNLEETGLALKKEASMWCSNVTYSWKHCSRSSFHREELSPLCSTTCIGATIVISARYVNMLNTFLTSRMHDLDIENMSFQQDGATSHTAQQSMEAIRQLFGRPSFLATVTFHGLRNLLISV
ncbi:hypothetical protein C0J52_21920 [Blattella germanica]|nr:hypothetical protein C0J52_21920 [Blattella germanica]